MLPGTKQCPRERPVWARKDVTKLSWDPNTDHFDIEKSAFIPTNIQKERMFCNLQQEKSGAGCRVGGCLSTICGGGRGEAMVGRGREGVHPKAYFCTVANSAPGLQCPLQVLWGNAREIKKQKNPEFWPLHTAIKICIVVYIYSIWFLPHCCESVRKKSLLAGKIEAKRFVLKLKESR